MNRRASWAMAVVCLLGMAGAGPSLAQLEINIEGLEEENLEDYLDPLNTGLGTTLNSAVFRTGYVPTEGFNFSIGLLAMAVGFDDADRTYVPTLPESYSGVTASEVPTVIGDPAGSTISGPGGLQKAYPGGFDLEGIEMATPQVAVGSIFGTRGVVRYMAGELGDTDLGDLSYLGYGAQHSISQWLPDLPVDLAAGIFVHSFESGDEVVKISSTHVNLTASKQFGVLQPYVGVGYDATTTDVKVEDEVDPEDSVEISLESDNVFHLTLGAMARLSAVGVFFEFNAAAGTGFALGLDIGL
ncbi:MAG: hypothetical protein GF330_01125 [Candidatus Eisenbacteria bacterium]|nr:hypothetical protein [Candidatus Eisenbacteria bacterium]